MRNGTRPGPAVDAGPLGGDAVDWRPHPEMRELYASEEERRAALLRGFDATARHYDNINRLMSFGTDGRYRREALLRSGLRDGMHVLDVGCGTGMTAGSAKDIVGPQGRVVGVDPSEGMLAVATTNGRVHEAIIGSAEALPVEEDRFDMVTMTFALRHVSYLLTVFSEFKGVLKPGGKVLVLEMTTPTSAWQYHLVQLYMKHVVPQLAALRPGGRTARWLYRYCWESHDRCVRPDLILQAMSEAGLRDVGRDVQLRIFSEYRGRNL